MDEYNQGWDPEVKRYFRKIANSFALFAFWLLLIATLGLGFKLAIVKGSLQWQNYLFYSIFLLTFLLLLLIYYRMWRNLK